ncbi:hypothetical protein SDC9_100376 [bioreactor metagenome]|uniref:Uncharacterized protein n=1 Tax=bioreactor metagenome TaxID=1076179 RepID=A0A645ALJ7_9ZZZZ
MNHCLHIAALIIENEVQEELAGGLPLALHRFTGQIDHTNIFWFQGLVGQR